MTRKHSHILIRLSGRAVLPANALLILLLLIMGSCASYDRPVSPDGRIQLITSFSSDGSGLSVLYDGDSLLQLSGLGLSIDGVDYTRDVLHADPEVSAFDETWETVNGKYPIVRNHYNEYTYQVVTEDSDQAVYKLILRVYDKGFAYRFSFETADLNEGLEMKERTHIRFQNDFSYWAYNGEHHNVGPIRHSEEALEEVRIPMVIRDDQDHYLAIHEAAIFDFAPFSLNASAGDGSITINTDYSTREGAFTTSWRTFIIGDRPGDLVESNLLVNLNDPCKIDDPSWIRPGKSMWDWRVWGYVAPDGFEYGLNTVSHKRFIDFASENNIQYLLIDADWYGAEFSEESDPTTSRDGVDIEECMRYAKEKKVGVILYLNDVGAKKFGLERVLKQFADWGAAGVKYGFMKGTWEEKVRQTRRIVELCASHQLMVNFHDNPVPPSGDRRTWPNLVTKEYNHAQADARRSHYPETAVNTPFINMIAGPLDVTNGWFDLNTAFPRPKVFEEIPGTVAAEVAKLIVIYTGLSVLPDAPEAYLTKEDLFDCIRKMPPQFDDFKVLDGEIDEYIVVARGAGEDWFIGSLTNREARSLEIDLDFLPRDRQFRATLYEDASDSHYLENKESYGIRTMNVNHSNRLPIALGAGGGNAIHLQAVRTNE